MRITLHSLSADDAPAMSELHALITAPWDPPWDTQTYENLLTQPYIYAFGLKRDTNLRSFIIVQYGEPLLDIIYIMTHPHDHGQGYGSRVYMHMLGHLVKIHTIESIILEVCEKNNAAIQFYKELGFKHINTRKNYYKSNNSLFFNAFVLINNTIRND